MYHENVLCVPNLRRNLLSVKKLEIYNIKVIFEKGRVLFNGKGFIGIDLRNNLYEISFRMLRDECLSMEIEAKRAKLWLKRYRHISYTNLKKLIKYNMVDGIEKHSKFE